MVRNACRGLPLVIAEPSVQGGTTSNMFDSCAEQLLPAETDLVVVEVRRMSAGILRVATQSSCSWIESCCLTALDLLAVSPAFHPLAPPARSTLVCAERWHNGLLFGGRQGTHRPGQHPRCEQVLPLTLEKTD